MLGKGGRGGEGEREGGRERGREGRERGREGGRERGREGEREGGREGVLRMMVHTMCTKPSTFLCHKMYVEVAYNVCVQ